MSAAIERRIVDDLGRRRGKPWIVCAALRHADGRIVAGARHWDTIMQGQMAGGLPRYLPPEEQESLRGWAESEQGFVDQHGNFYTRAEAQAVAVANGQVEDDHKSILISEDLY